MNGYDYIASPYTDPDPLVREQRYLRVSEVVVTLLRNGIHCYSPVVHCHELSKTWGLPHDSSFWKEYDEVMIRAARGVTVVRLDGWARSVGVKGEIQLAIELGKPLSYISGDPGNVEDIVEIHPHRTKPAAE